MTVTSLYVGYGMSVSAQKIVEYINSTMTLDDYKTTMEAFPTTNPTTFRFRKFLGTETDSDDESETKQTRAVYEDTEHYNLYAIERVLAFDNEYTEHYNLDAIKGVLAFDNEYVEIVRYNDHTCDEYDTHMFVGHIRNIKINSTSDKHPCPHSIKLQKKVRGFLRKFFDDEELKGFIYKTWTNGCSCCV